MTTVYVMFSGKPSGPAAPDASPNGDTGFKIADESYYGTYATRDAAYTAAALCNEDENVWRFPLVNNVYEYPVNPETPWMPWMPGGCILTHTEGGVHHPRELETRFRIIDAVVVGS